MNYMEQLNNSNHGMKENQPEVEPHSPFNHSVNSVINNS